MGHWHNGAMPRLQRHSDPENREEAKPQPGPCTATADDCEPPPVHRMPAAPIRWALQLFACLSLATGIAGIFIPGLPTTVFILMAGWAAARSSERLHHWLWRHRLFGPMLRNWARGGFMGRRAKWSATAMMGLCSAILLWARPPAWAQATSLICMGCVLTWLWFRPEP